MYSEKHEPTGVLLFRERDVTFNQWDQSQTGKASLGTLVDSSISDTIGGSLARFEQCSMNWDVKCDELVYCLEGRFTVRAGKESFEAGPGDVIWLPEGNTVSYESEKALVFFTRYPVNRASGGQRLSSEKRIDQQVRLYRFEDLTLSPWASAKGPGVCNLAVPFSTDVSSTIGCSYGEFDNCSIPWHIQYDEFMVGMEGVARMSFEDGQSMAFRAGEIVWIPKGTQFNYEGDKALVFASVYPIDWRARLEALEAKG